MSTSIAILAQQVANWRTNLGSGRRGGRERGEVRSYEGQSCGTITHAAFEKSNGRCFVRARAAVPPREWMEKSKVNISSLSVPFLLTSFPCERTLSFGCRAEVQPLPKIDSTPPRLTVFFSFPPCNFRSLLSITQLDLGSRRLKKGTDRTIALFFHEVLII